MQFQGIAAQPVGPFHQVDIITLIRQGQGAGHTGSAAAHHQSPTVDSHFKVFQGFHQTGFGYRHIDEIPAFLRGLNRRALVDPGALVPDIGHFKEIFV